MYPVVDEVGEAITVAVDLDAAELDDSLVPLHDPPHPALVATLVDDVLDRPFDLAAAYDTPYDCRGYRLPTEAEWEYVARAGTTTATYNHDLDDGYHLCQMPNLVLDPIAWFCGNSEGRSHEVGTREPNDWGLYDVLGNVWEWCHDWYGAYLGVSGIDPTGPSAGSLRVGRGGSWRNRARDTTAAYRFNYSPGRSVNSFGFRPLRSLVP